MAAILSVNCQTILFGLCIGLLVYYVTRRLKYRLPPGPWCVPVIGNVQGKYTPVNSGESGQSISIQQYTVIDCGFGQQIRLRVKKTAVVRETSLYQFVIHLHFFKIAQSRRLMATDPQKPVNNCFVIYIYFFFKKYSLFPLYISMFSISMSVESENLNDILTSI